MLTTLKKSLAGGYDFISVGGGFWYLIAVIDLYSGYIVRWDLSATMTPRDGQKVIDFALLQYGFYEGRISPRSTPIMTLK